jgi:hypothetical protein
MLHGFLRVIFFRFTCNWLQWDFIFRYNPSLFGDKFGEDLFSLLKLGNCSEVCRFLVMLQLVILETCYSTSRCFCIGITVVMLCFGDISYRGNNKENTTLYTDN